MAVKRKKSGGGGANWMDTYGDMVTLLLCFFVMLYAMSSVDQNRWIALVQALNPDAVVASGPEVDVPPDGPVVSQESIDQEIEQLFESMQSYIQSANMTGQVSIGRGNGYVFISFDETVFFGPDSWVLLDSGQEVLDQISLSIAEAADSINEIRVLGHTAQGDPNRPNNPTGDRFLASNRATVVTVYLQEKNIIDPARLVSVGYGQWRPVSSNDTSEGRARNRRVELIISGLDLDSELGDDIQQYYTMRDTVDSAETSLPTESTEPPAVTQTPET